MRGWKKWILICAVVTLALFGALAAWVAYVNWSAKRDAQEFCNEIAIDSNISEVTAKAENRKILWGASGDYYHNAPVGAGSPYTFYFFGFVMDKAVCEVSIDRAGKVRSKQSEMEYD